ncbi:DNA-directed RNA polymerase subunit beta [Sporosarcina obsidiansis]|uniref:DNA-directed RNA polymerase subunit beta n=1 Tax=Sporosarcina obsidiansis TaxID=2660748 RepID=UPI00129AFDD1|nr:DNA-directed RNA polymerase subunit beta [Sporosarcina obsidiansis]
MTDENRTTEKQLPQPNESTTQVSGTSESVSRKQRRGKQAETDASFWTRIKAKWPRKEQDEKPEIPVSELKWVRVRMIPIWLRLLILLALLVIAAILGAVIGFSVIGDGSAGDVFHKETWQHIFDIMNGKN